eukprot:ANDGO_00418.mRNA.1 hypothetical protein
MKPVTFILYVWKSAIVLSLVFCCATMLVDCILSSEPHVALVTVKVYAALLSPVLGLTEWGRRALVRKWLVAFRYPGIRALLYGFVVVATLAPVQVGSFVQPYQQASGFILLILASIQLISQITCLGHFFKQRQAEQYDYHGRKHQRQQAGIDAIEAGHEPPEMDNAVSGIHSTGYGQLGEDAHENVEI